MALNSSDFKIVTFWAFPYFTVASAKGCSLLEFKDTIYCSTSLSLKMVLNAAAFSTVGFPSVIVPVLSIIKVSTFAILSSASAFLTNTPFCAPLPTPTIIDIGVAKPNAQGQAIINTAMAFTKA